jgi:hypothetical protein
MAAQLINIEFVKTYATIANAVKAVEAEYGQHEAHLRYMVIPVETSKGLRYGVAFIGQSAFQNMVHFSGFNLIG